MARTPKIACDSCGAGIVAGVPFCGSCERPTGWATHEERTAWEVAQWRKARPGRLSDPHAQVLTLPRYAAQAAPAMAVALPDSEPEPSANGFLTEQETAALMRPPSRAGSGFAETFKRVLDVLRRLFARNAMVPLDTKPPTPASAPASEPPHIQLVRTPEPEPEPEPPIARADETIAPPKPAPKPRKRPNPPTNKDMLKQALTVLTNVERRLEHLEQEVAGIDPVRKTAADAVDEAPAVGE